MSQKKRLLISFAAVLLIAAVAGSIWFSTHFSPIARDRVAKAIAERFDSRVELKSFAISVLPHPHATGEGLVLYYKNRTDIPPLIAIRRFTIDAGWGALLAHVRRIGSVRLEGLEIHVPPRRPEEGEPQRQKRRFELFVLEEVIADGAVLEILPRKEGKEPLKFELTRLTLRDAGMESPMKFRATLTNPKPPGKIESTGEFGPWEKEAPSRTPVAGQYTFRQADLSVFKGISGILSSDGKYQGTLEHIGVTGTTDTPDFAVSTGGHPVHLTTDFQSVVDGTDGDTYLQPVTAHFLGSTIVAVGKVEGIHGKPGKTSAPVPLGETTS